MLTLPAGLDVHYLVESRGGSRISGKGIYMYNVVEVRFADFISFSLKYPIKMRQFGLTETKLFHFHRISKTGAGRGLKRIP